MTTVLAYGDGERVWMAGDRYSDLYGVPCDAGPKVARISIGNDVDALVGISGAAGIGLIIRHDLNLSSLVTAVGEMQSNPNLIAHSFAKLITNLSVDAGFTQDGRMDATILFACKGRIWSITHNEYTTHEDGIASIGSGGDVALGALDAYLDADGGSKNPGHTLRCCVEIAANRDKHTGGTIQIEQA